MCRERATEHPVLSEFGEYRDRVGVSEIEPSHHTIDEVSLIGNVQEPPRFIDRRRHLNEDCLRYYRSVEQRAKIGRLEVAMDIRELRGRPIEPWGIERPEVLMRINRHA